MRGVAGIAFVFVGLVMGYFVLSGKLPNATGNVVAPTAASNTVTNVAPGTPGYQSSINIVKQSGSAALAYGNGPMGLPTMAHMNDLVPSVGGMK